MLLEIKKYLFDIQTSIDSIDSYLGDNRDFNPPSRKASADAKSRFNSSVLAPFFESRACSGVHTI